MCTKKFHTSSTSINNSNNFIAMLANLKEETGTESAFLSKVRPSFPIRTWETKRKYSLYYF